MTKNYSHDEPNPIPQSVRLYFSGAISARLSADAAAVRCLVGDTLSLAVTNLATIVAAIIIGFTASWQLTLVILVAVPFIGLQSSIQMKWTKGFVGDIRVCFLYPLISLRHIPVCSSVVLIETVSLALDIALSFPARVANLRKNYLLLPEKT